VSGDASLRPLSRISAKGIFCRSGKSAELACEPRRLVLTVERALPHGDSSGVRASCTGALDRSAFSRYSMPSRVFAREDLRRWIPIGPEVPLDYRMKASQSNSFWMAVKLRLMASILSGPSARAGRVTRSSAYAPGDLPISSHAAQSLGRCKHCRSMQLETDPPMRNNARPMQESGDDTKGIVVLATHERSGERVTGSMLQAIARMSTTLVNNRIGLATDAAVACALLYSGMRRHDFHPIAVFPAVFSGLALFSFIEYGFHRWLFHGSAPGLMEKGHRLHHQNPLGYDSLPFFLPPLIILGLTALLAAILPTTYALLLSGGLATGYAFYGLSHCAIHGVRFRYLPARRWAANHHIHHYHPDKNFGVTTPLWDILLKTRYASKTAKPGRFARNTPGTANGRI
jgi:dihydroceramide fatty acyl 2-hydroxylase